MVLTNKPILLRILCTNDLLADIRCADTLLESNLSMTFKCQPIASFEQPSEILRKFELEEETTQSSSGQTFTTGITKSYLMVLFNVTQQNSSYTS